jgi:hypothetical protein
MRMRTYAELWITLAVVMVAMGALAAFAAAGWPGEPNGCSAAGRCFCEAFRHGWVKQPANTGSNLGFIAVGLGIAVALGARRNAGRPAQNAMQGGIAASGRGSLAGFYAVVVALLGPGSMALHASMTGMGGRIDVLSMYLWVSFCVAYGALRLFGAGTGAFPVIYAAIAGVLTWSLWFSSWSVDILFGVLCVGFGLVEGLVWLRRRHLSQARGWLLLAGASFATAFAVWLPSRRSDGPLCDPDSLLQGHALWHLLCALSTWAIWRYYASERDARGQA